MNYKGRFITSSKITTSGTSYIGDASGMWGVKAHLQTLFSNSWPKALTVPNKPVISSVSVGNASASIAFSIDDTGGSAITNYTVTSSPGNISVSGLSSPITVSGLTNGISYTFTVIATNSQGNSLPSDASTSVIPFAGINTRSEFRSAVASGNTFTYVNQSNSSSETAVVSISPWGTYGIYLGQANISATAFPGNSTTTYTTGSLSAEVITNLTKINDLCLGGSFKIGINGIQGSSEQNYDYYRISALDGISSLSGSWSGYQSSGRCSGVLTALTISSIGLIRQNYSTDISVNGGQGFYATSSAVWLFL